MGRLCSLYETEITDHVLSKCGNVSAGNISYYIKFQIILKGFLHMYSYTKSNCRTWRCGLARCPFEKT